MIIISNIIFKAEPRSKYGELGWARAPPKWLLIYIFFMLRIVLFLVSTMQLLLILMLFTYSEIFGSGTDTDIDIGIGIGIDTCFKNECVCVCVFKVILRCWRWLDCVFSFGSLEVWYYPVIILLTGNMTNAEVAIDALSIWWEFLILFSPNNRIAYSILRL